MKYRIDTNSRVLRSLVALAIVGLSTGCYKEAIEGAPLTSNPFDRDYEGPSVFVSEGTYTQITNIGPVSVLRQVIAFRVRTELFLSPAPYSVQVKDLQSGVTELLNADPPGSDNFKFFREPAPGQSICLELRLSNNQSAAGPTTICATL